MVLFKILRARKIIILVLNIHVIEGLYERLIGVKTTRKGNNLLVLVNKRIKLPSTYEPHDLILIDKKVPVVRSGMRLRKEASRFLIIMTDEARRQKVRLVVASSYRSYQDQKDIFKKYTEHFGFRRSFWFSARPGYSQHQLGTTVDFISGTRGSKLSTGFERTKEAKWLSKNAHRFGYVLSYPKGKEQITGYTYEPWHYRYIGVENAKKIIQSHLTLEEFLQIYGDK